MSNKSRKRRLDKLWSEAVKTKADNRCEICTLKKPLNSHHIYSRRFLSTRWYLPNGIALCVSCHFFAHQKSLEFSIYLKENKGEEWYHDLFGRHRELFDKDYEKVEKELKSEVV